MTNINREVGRIQWMARATWVRFVVGRAPGTPWQTSRDEVREWASESLSGRHEVLLGREAPEHFTDTSAELVVLCDNEADVARVRGRWVAP